MWTRDSLKRVFVAAHLAGAAFFAAPSAKAFPHVVKPGETLAQIALRVYGDVRYETILAAANGLDPHSGGTLLRYGMRLEVPAPTHHRCQGGESWLDLARAFLGDPKRAELLAKYNNANPSTMASPGQEISVPFILTHVVDQGDMLSTIAMRYMQDPAKSWDLDAFNDLRGASFHRGDVILVPLVGLTLTEEGRSEARLGEQRTKSEGRIDDIEAQRKAEGEIPGLLEAVRRGRYVDAVARGNRVLGTGRLAGPQLARVHRALLEAYVALDTPEAAADACAAWKANEPGASLDPKKVSPKIRAACNEVPKP